MAIAPLLRPVRALQRIVRVAPTLVALVLAGAPAAAQFEGPLDNDSTLPIELAAEAELARGDFAFAGALRLAADADAHSVSTAWTAVAEAWRNALVHSRGGDSASPFPVLEPGGVSPWEAAEPGVLRFTEGVEEGVFRRLARLPRAGQLVWTERFSALAEEALQQAAGAPAAVARIEREMPATRAAARAAILLAEFAFESGEPDAARRWLARSRRHLAALGLDAPDLTEGIALRERALPRAAANETEAWRRATTLEFVAARALEEPRNASRRARPLGAGPQAGMAFLDGERALVQTPSALWILAGPRAELTGPFENDAWLRPADLEVEPAVAPGNAPGWRLDPAARGASAVVVVGRSLAGRANVLARVDCPASRAEPSVRWARRAAAATGAESDGDEAEYEFQPGPLWTDDLVIVLVRRASATSGERELELRALDPEDGALRWTTYLGKGGERVRDQGRFARTGLATQIAEPLLWTPDGVFAGGALGFAALVDPLDGRVLFAVRDRRRAAEERGWTGWGSALGADGQILWAPADSDHVYRLDARGPGRRGTPLGAPPEAIGEAEALVAGDGGEILVLARAGTRRTLARWDQRSGAKQDSLRLAPEEAFTGRALASEERVIAASDRAVYLFDRKTDLALLAAPKLGGPIPRGGNVWAQGSRVFVLSSREVEIFSAR
ncbi:MAG TPA: hypothetical protein VM509_02760 [Planctomycetota bacterium]|nr:hypothetical protein [Planctomycetota bacterium]